MNKTNFTAILQVALWRNEGMSELEIRQLLSNLVSDGVIKAGIGLADYLNSIKQIQEQTQQWKPKRQCVLSARRKKLFI